MFQQICGVYLMKKRNVFVQGAVAAALVAAFGVAQAGTITAGNVNYAVEAMASTTPVTLGNVVYNMGVARTTTQPFTLIYTLSSGTFNATPAVPTAAGGTAAIVGSSLKRGGAGSNEVVYDIVVSGNISATDTLTLVAPVVVGHNLTTSGNAVSMSVKLLDTGETACVDNSGTPSTCAVTSARATAAKASGFDAAMATNDTTTVTDVGATVPLAGFVAGTGAGIGLDTATVAKVAVSVNNNTAGVKGTGGVVDYTLVAGDTVTLTLTDATGFLGLKANKLCFDKDADTTLCEAGEVFTVSGNTATLAGIPGNSAAFGIGGAASGTLSFETDATTPMGVSRTIGLAGAVTPTTAGAVGFSYAPNASFWQWSSNGTQLQSPWFTTYTGYQSNFFLTNTGTNPASYTARVLTETGNACTAGTGASGTIPANGQLFVSATGAAGLCSSMATATRGTAIFTINAPSATVQGGYNVVAPNGSISNQVLVRPGSN
ncbi:hypothetical protein [Paucibacter soli]|uniref:hypothetical protein n=1 Tax=Paucibacter soli TaxID=3133433 RepID=UPI0030A58859